MHYPSKIICEKMIKGETSECSLAMVNFFYEALLKTNNEKYKTYILEEIRRDYLFMLNNGATSVWETIEGDVGHNSLCHAWNCLPIYYFDKLL